MQNFTSAYWRLVCRYALSTFLITSICASAILAQSGPDFSTDCGDGQTIEILGAGSDFCGNTPDISLSIPNSGNIDEITVELVYKSENPGSTHPVIVDGSTITIPQVLIQGNSPNVYVYRGTINGSASTIEVNDNNNSCGNNRGLQSLVAFVTRNVDTGVNQRGVYTQLNSYCDIETLTIDIPTDSEVRDIDVSIPISEITTDGRYLTVRATAGGVTRETTITGPDANLNNCCLDIVEVPTLPNVPGTADEVVVEIITDSANNPNGSGCGQSYVLGGALMVTVECNGEGSLGNFVWNDTNANGIFDESTSQGINGVPVVLWSAGADGVIGGGDDVVVDNTTTANDAFGNPGYYNFVIDNTGDYFVEFPTSSSSLVLTYPNQSVQTDNNSDAGFDGLSSVVSIDVNSTGINKDNPTIDAGYVAKPTCDLDDLSGASTDVNLNFGPAIPFSSALSSSAIGGEIDLRLELLTANSGASASVDGATSRVSFSNNAISTSVLTLTYDGIDGSDNLDPTGLGGVDLSGDDEGFSFDIFIDGSTFLPKELDISIRAYTDAGNWSTSTIRVVATTMDEQSLYFSKSSFTTNAGSGIDWSNVGALEIELNTITSAIDLSFNTIQSSCVSGCDYGDAPLSYGDISFAVDCGSPAFLGQFVDADNGTQNNVTASGDDNDGTDDEDGVVFVGGPNFRKGTNKTIEIEFSADESDAYISGWIDWNGNGQFDQSEQIINDDEVGQGVGQVSGTNTYSVAVPSHAVCGFTYARFIITSDQNEGPTGLYCDHPGCNDGEVEDYKVWVRSNVSANIGPDFSICGPQLVTLTASGGTTYQWSTGQSGQSIDVQVNATDTYVVTVTDATQCTGTDEVVVTVDDLPVLTGDDVVTCIRNPITIDLTATGGAGGYTYFVCDDNSPVQNGTFNFTPWKDTTFCFYVVDANGCVGTTDVFVDIFRNATNGGEISADQDNCGAFDPAMLQSVSPASGGQSNLSLEYVWLQSTGDCTPPVGNNFGDWTEIPGANSLTYDPPTLTETTCFIRCARRDGCIAYEGESNVVTITISDEITAQASNNGTLSCNNTSVQLNATPSGLEYDWSGPDSYTSAVQNPSINMPGEYTVTVTDVTTGCTAVASTIVDGSTDLPMSIASVDGVLTCDNSSVDLFASPLGMTYNWSGPGNFSSNSDNPTGITTPGIYTVTVTGGNACSIVKTVEVLEDISTPSVTVMGDDICEGQSTTLTASTTDNADCASCCERTVTNTNSCNQGPNSHVLYFVHDGSSVLYQMTTNNKLVECDNGTFTFSGTATEKNGTDVIDFSIFVSGKTSVGTPKEHWCGATNFTGLEYYTSVYGTYQSVEHGTITLRGRGAPAQLGNGGNNVSLDFGFSAWVSLSGGDGYYDAERSDINFNVSTTCTPVTTPDLDYLWSDGSTAETITVDPTVDTDYTVTVTSCNGCSSSATATVTISDPVVDAGGDATICTSDASPKVIGQVSPAASTILWTTSGSGTFSANDDLDPRYVPSATDIQNGSVTLTLTATNNGCAISDDVTITFEGPEASVNDDFERVCAGDDVTVTVTGSNSYTYEWVGPNGFTQNGKTLNLTNVDIDDSGVYYLQVTDANGCVSIVGNKEFLLAVDDEFVRTEVGSFNLATTDWTETISLPQFDGQAGMLTKVVVKNQAGVSTRYGLEQTGSGTVVPTFNGTYDVDVSTPLGSTLNLDISLSDSDNATAYDGTFDYAGTSGFRGDALAYDEDMAMTTNVGAFTGNGTVDFTGDTDVSSSFSGSGNAVNFVRTIAGYAAVIHYEYEQDLVVPATIELCAGEALDITAVGNGNVAYSWTTPNGAVSGNNVSINNVDANDAGMYTVTQTLDDCTVITATTNVIVNPNPSLDLGADVEICDGDDYQLVASAATGTAPYTYTLDGVNMPNGTATVSPSDNTVYTVVATDSKGCTATDQIEIVLKDNPIAVITSIPTICALEDVQLTADNAGSGATYQWTFDSGTPATATGPSAVVQWPAAGSYDVTLTVTKNGCSTTTVNSIIITQEVQAIAGPDQSICRGGDVVLDGSGTPGGNYTWTVEAGDPTSIDNGANSEDVLVSPRSNTTYRLTVSQNGCTRVDFVSVTVDVNKNPTADAGADSFQCEGEDFVIGGNPTGTPPLDDPTAELGYIWSPAADLNDETLANPTANIDVPGDYTFEVIVYSFNTGCADTSQVTITIEDKAKVGDFVWSDDNYNGIQDAGEAGINGVEVRLLDDNNTEVATTVTSTMNGIPGSYMFEVCKGQYRIDVNEADVPNTIVTLKDEGNDATDSDINNAGRTILFTLNPGDNDPTRDAGFASVIDLELVKEVSDETPNVGDVITYTITVTNQGPNNATGVSVEDIIPNGLSNVTNISNGGSMTSGVINWTGLSIADGSSITVTYDATVEAPVAGVSYVNVAQVTGADQFDTDSTPDNDDGDQSEDDEDPEEITPQVADLNLVKTVNDATPSVGDVVTFTITVSNDGPDAATGVRVRDGLPNGYTNISNISAPGILNGAGTAINWSNQTIASGATATFTFDAEVLAPAGNTSYVNLARIQLSDQFDPDSTPGNPADTDGDGNVGSQDPDDNQDSDDEDDGDDAFVVPSGTISGNVSEDTDNDDIADDPIAGVTITLTDASGNTQTTTTDADGNYEFTDLDAGEYTVTEQDETEIDEDFVDVFDGDESPEDTDDAVDALNDDSIEVTLEIGEDDEDNNFVEEQLGTISGNVSEDTDNDDVANDPIAGVEITLTDVDAGTTQTTTTDADGNYEFTDLEPGEYTITEQDETEIDEDFVDVFDGDETPEDADDAVDALNDDSIEVTLTPGEDDDDNNFVEEQLGTISGNVSEDTDNDDVANDPIAGVEITLTDVDAGTTVTTTTDADGNYEFTGLEAGEYTVTEQDEAEIDEDFVDVFDGDETPEDADDAVDALNDDSIEVTLTAGEDDEDNNFVEEQLGTITGNVSLDDDNNDSADTPQDGVTVTLTDVDAGTTQTTTTDADGNYEFTGLEPGDYEVTVGTPADGQSVSDEDEATDGDAGDADQTVDDSITVTLEPGEDDVENNFVDELLAQLGDFVFFDANGNGLQDVDEDGINDITVNLLDASGAPLQTTTTVNDPVTGEPGYYQFTVEPGDYIVEFVESDGYVFTQADINDGDTDATDDDNDSDADTETGRSHVISIEAGESEQDIDAGLFLPLSLGDLVWLDMNNNGVFDEATESGIEGVVVMLWSDPNNDGSPDEQMMDSDGVMMETVTDENGNYLFTGLAPGNYIVQITTANFDADQPLDGLQSSTGNDPSPDPDNDVNGDDNGTLSPLLLGVLSGTITLESADEPTDDGDADNLSNLTVDFGFYVPVRLGDYVWDDVDGDGFQDPEEEGINGVTVNLFDENGALVATVMTMQNPEAPSEQGYYQFDDIAPGSYYIEFETPVGFIPTSQNAPDAGDVNDSDVTDANGPGTTDLIVLEAGDDNQTIDAGFFIPASIGDFVWEDNGDNVQSPGDVGLNGVTVMLFNNDDPTLPFRTLETMDNPITGEPGYYLFDSLPVGNYFVMFDLLDGYSFVQPNGVTPDLTDVDDEVDSDVIDFSTGRTGSFDLTRGQNITDVDAGFAPPVLPIELLDFYGRHLEDSELNRLTWITATEINNDRFVLERSINGSDFEAIVEVEGAGNSAGPITYSHEDQDLPTGGLYVYRLKQIDFDGTYSYADKLVYLEVDKKTEVTAGVYPNPATSWIQVGVTTDKDEDITIGVYDQRGRLVIDQAIMTSAPAGTTELTVPVAHLPSATYVVRIQVGNELFNEKLLIIK